MDRMFSWTDSELESITVLQLNKALDCYNVAYCEGKLKTGENVLVMLPFTKLPRTGLRREIVNQAKRAGVYANKLNIFSAIEISP